MQKIGKEIKIGLAVIGVLVAAFGYILFRKLTRPDDLAAAPPAATAPAAAAPAAGAADKPTVVSATVTGRPADPATDSARNPPRSLFGSTRRLQASETTEAGADPRGSFMPPANNDSTATSGVAANNGNGNLAAPENRFSQFGHHNDAPSSFNSRDNGSAAATSEHSHNNTAPFRRHDSPLRLTATIPCSPPETTLRRPTRPPRR